MYAIARVVLAAATSASLSALAPALAEAKVQITVDLASQTIHVEDGDKVFDWKVSSGKPGYETPPGKYGVLWMDKDHHSDEYDGAYMPDSIFFAPGFAIHGFAKSRWGHAVSHGCVRLPVDKAALLFGLVKADGAEVNIVGDAPEETIASSRSRREDAAGRDDGAGPDDGQSTAQGYDARGYGYGEARDYAGQGYAGQGYAPQGYAARGYGNAPQQAPTSGYGLFGSVY